MVHDDFRDGLPGSAPVGVGLHDDAAPWTGLGNPHAEGRALLECLRARSSGRTWASSLTILAVSVVLFISLGLLRWDLGEIALLVLALFVHEAGHYVAMVGFGYRDVQMFFIPLLGAAVSASRTDAPAYQRTLVALAGPLPGILLGTGLAIVAVATEHQLVASAAILFLALNLLNLLPIPPLDGGHVLQETLLCRSRFLEAGVRVVAAAGLLVLGFANSDLAAWIFGVFAAVAASAAIKINGIVAQLRETEHVAPNLDEPTEATLETLELISLQVQATFTIQKPEQLPSLVRNVIDAWTSKPPGALATVLLLGLYAAGFLVGLVGSILAVAATGP
jgi:Zn-dependent protease